MSKKSKKSKKSRSVRQKADKNAKKSPVQLALKSVPKKRRPKKKCCQSRPRCRPCPIAMLKDNTLPPGLTVRHRRVVVVDAD